jgi:hypothetical protein
MSQVTTIKQLHGRKLPVSLPSNREQQFLIYATNLRLFLGFMGDFAPRPRTERPVHHLTSERRYHVSVGLMTDRGESELLSGSVRGATAAKVTEER